MTAQLFEETLSQVDHTLARPDVAITGYRPEISSDSLPAQWQIRLQNLQVWICELLIKNQQLRMALVEAKARAARRSDEAAFEAGGEPRPAR